MHLYSHEAAYVVALPAPSKKGVGDPFLVKPDLVKIPPPPPFFTFSYSRSPAKNPGKIEAGPRPLSRSAFV